MSYHLGQDDYWTWKVHPHPTWLPQDCPRHKVGDYEARLRMALL